MRNCEENEINMSKLIDLFFNGLIAYMHIYIYVKRQVHVMARALKLSESMNNKMSYTLDEIISDVGYSRTTGLQPSETFTLSLTISTFSTQCQ